MAIFDRINESHPAFVGEDIILLFRLAVIVLGGKMITSPTVRDLLTNAPNLFIRIVCRFFGKPQNDKRNLYGNPTRPAFIVHKKCGILVECRILKLYFCDNLNLNQSALWQVLNCNTASCRLFCEVFCVYLIESGKVTDVG